MPIYALGPKEPRIDPTAYVHPDAVVIGGVEIGAESTVWPHAVLRGDSSRISIGRRTSIQDGTVIHCSKADETVIGNGCVVGHNAYVEGCLVEDECLIGSMSAVMIGARLGRGCAVGAGAVVTMGTEVPPRALALGVPAKIRPDAMPVGAQDRAAQMYAEYAHRYRAELRRLD